MIYKRYASFIKRFMFVSILGYLFISCNDTYSEGQMEDVILMSDVKIDVEKNLTLPVGMECAVNYEIVPENVTDPKLKWESTDTNVAEVSQEGVITTKATGKASINISQAVAFNVLRSINLNVVGPAQSISINNIEFYEGASVDILDYITITPTDSYKVFDYEIGDKTIISCEDGIIVGLKEGTTTITVKAKDGSNIEATANVTVLESVPVENIVFEEGQEFALNENAKLQFNVTPGNGVIEVLNWESSDNKILTVTNKGYITAKDFGTATITVSNSTEKIAEVEVIVAPGKINDWGESLSIYSLKSSDGGSSVMTDGKLVVTYASGKKRQDLQRGTTFIDVDTYPILAIKREAASIGKLWQNMDFRIDGGVVGGINMVWANVISIDNNTNVYYVDMSKITFGGVTLEGKGKTKMSMFDFKTGHDAAEQGYTIHWVKTFKKMSDLNEYLNKENNSNDNF